MPEKPIRIGSGAAWWGDRVEPAILNADKGDLDYLCFETMAEATVSAAQVRARRDPSFPGYDTYLDDRIKGVLPGCLKRGTKIVTNQGWINPNAAAERIVHWLRHFGAKGVKVAAVNGALITEVVNGSPADRAGLKPGDVLVGVENKEVTDSASMLNLIAALKPDTTALLKAIRDKDELVFKVNVGKRPKPKRDDK